MSEKKPVPAFNVVLREKCPICGKPSYSRSGTHPQCAASNVAAARRSAQRLAMVEAAPAVLPFAQEKEST